MKKFISLVVLLLLLPTPVLAEVPRLAKYKLFDEVFKESINTEIDNLSYGIICFPGLGNDSAAVLEDEDLKKLLNCYKGQKGERILAPFNSFKISTYTVPEEEKEREGYFYIGVSAELPDDLEIWHRTVKMSQICFGGEQCGDITYGGFGRAKSSYQDYEEGSFVFPKPIPSNFVWYRPYNKNKSKVCEIGMELYNKYKVKAKPFGDYRGTKDDKYFEGFDGTWQTKFILPDCLPTDGCSDWAEYTLQLAAINFLIPYELTENYTEPITRANFCKLVANMLNNNGRQNRPIEDFFKNPDGYTILENKVKEMNLSKVADSIYYNDVQPITDDIKYLSALGIVNGLGNGDFDPNGYITREQVCAIFGNIFNVDTSYRKYYSDSLIGKDINTAKIEKYDDDDEISNWAKKGVYEMKLYEIMQGVGNNIFSPKEYCTLEQAIVIMYQGRLDYLP